MSEYEIKKGIGLVDNETGEVLDPKKYIKDGVSQVQEILDRVNKIAGTCDIPFRAQFKTFNRKSYFLTNTKETDGDLFQQIVQDNVKKLMMQPIGTTERAWIATFTPYLVYPSNFVQITDGLFPTATDFGKMMGLKRVRMEQVLNELVKYDVIKRIHKGTIEKITYINPFLYASGPLIETTTVLMFADSIYNVKKQ